MVIDGFAKGAPRHHHLVFKAHPLEDGRAPAARAKSAGWRRCMASPTGCISCAGGKLAQLAEPCAQRRHGEFHRRAAGAVARTAAESLRRGGLCQARIRLDPAAARFLCRSPTRPDTRAYRDYRHYLLETSQMPGGFYSARGRRANCCGRWST